MESANRILREQGPLRCRGSMCGDTGGMLTLGRRGGMDTIPEWSQTCFRWQKGCGIHGNVEGIP